MSWTHISAVSTVCLGQEVSRFVVKNLLCFGSGTDIRTQYPAEDIVTAPSGLIRNESLKKEGKNIALNNSVADISVDNNVLSASLNFL